MSARGSFRESRLPRVRAYVAEVCAPEQADEATSAAFVDFLARTVEGSAGDGEPDRVLLCATRSAAAGRFAVAVPLGRPELTLTAECRAMPELLALHANRERSADEALIAAHLASCAICAHTLERMRRAERAFAKGSGELPELEVADTTVDTAGLRQPEPRPERETPPGARTSRPPGTPGGPATYRRRSGGLVGALRRFGRTTRG